MACTLKAYESKLDAGSEAVRLTRRSKFNRNKTGAMVRYTSYQCDICKKWHLRIDQSKPDKEGEN